MGPRWRRCRARALCSKRGWLEPIAHLLHRRATRATSETGAGELLAPRSGPGITRFHNHAGSGEKEPFQATRPSSNRGKKNKTQECYSSWLSQPCASFQRIYGILKFSPSAQYFSKTKHLHQISAGRGYGCGAALLGSGGEGAYFSWQTERRPGLRAGPSLAQPAAEGSELPALNRHHHSHIIFNSSARRSPPSLGDLA